MTGLWDHIWTERAALVTDLERLTPDQWCHPTLCGEWDVEDVVAHLTAAASTTPWQWFRSIVGAGFRTDVHNRRRLEEHRGTTPAETLERFRAVVTSTVAPSGHTAAYLGEVVVHSEDIRRPLGLPPTRNTEALSAVADFFVSRDFAVRSRTVAGGLHLRATDGPFTAGDGLLATGPTLALVMTMAGRTSHLDELHGPGVATLRKRLAAD